VLASLHPLQYRDNPDRENELVMKDINYPVAVKDIGRFENQNNISVNVYGLDAHHHVDLLYLSKDEGGHYVLIKDFSRLITKQLSKHNGKKFFCKFCLHACYTRYTSRKV